MASNTPWRLYKVNTHAGGHTTPCVVSWPARLAVDGVAGGIRRQYGHITDVVPTVLEVLGVEPDRGRQGEEPLPLAGASLLATLTDAGAPSAHHVTVEEMNGHRGYYEDGWEVVTLHHPLTAFDDAEWELYDLTSDPSELDDRSEAEPERRARMAAAWEQEAWANQVYPLDEGSSIKYLLRPERSEAYRRAVTITPGTPTLERWRSVQLVWFRTVTIAVDLDFTAGDHGILVAHGDQGGGYALYVLDDELWFVHNDGRGAMRTCSGGALATGVAQVAAELRAVGKGVWDVRLCVDGVERSHLAEVPLLYGMAPFEGIDVGIDRRSPVSWELYERFGPFPWTGTLRSVTFEPGADAPDSPGNLLDLIRSMGLRFE